MDRKIGGITIRELTGFVLLILLFVLGLLLTWHTGRQQEAISRELEDSVWLALSGQWENARQRVDSARQKWEEGWNLQAAFSDHGPMEEIDALFAELKVCVSAGEQTDFARICAALARKMEAMGNAHRLSWWNVL